MDRAVGWTERVLPSVWADPVSRGCLIGMIAFFWLAASLTEPLFLIPMAGAAYGLWRRREVRAAAAAEPGDPDFF